MVHLDRRAIERRCGGILPRTPLRHLPQDTQTAIGPRSRLMAATDRLRHTDRTTTFQRLLNLLPTTDFRSHTIASNSSSRALRLPRRGRNLTNGVATTRAVTT